MIKDSIDRAELYYNLSDSVKRALSYVRDTNWAKIENGKYLIDGEKLYININSYKTKDLGDWEAHKQYIDIQYLISGEEKIGISRLDCCNSKIPYNTERDIEFYDGDCGDYITMRPGDFMIIYPHELHKPGIKSKDNIEVKKAVIKLAIDY